MRYSIDKLPELFPYKSFRKYQKKVLEKATQEFQKGTDVVIIEAPTGFGKSAVNVALARQFESAFYTTPQRKLVNQLANDEKLQKYLEPLLGRDTYTCEYSGENCRDCYVRDKENESCYKKAVGEQEGTCTYWEQKLTTMESPIALLTFAYLIIDNGLPEEYSFKDRDLLILDECHSLEGQVASMFAGYTVSPYSLPKISSGNLWDELSEFPEDAKKIGDITEWLDEVREKCQNYIAGGYGSTKSKYVEKCTQMVDRIRYMEGEIDDGREWVFDTKEVSWKNKKVLRPHIKPVSVDRFLRENIWSRADKIVLSSATIPFRGKPDRWLKRLGLHYDYINSKPVSYKKFRVPMTFPVENRPISLAHLGGKMTRKKEDENWRINVKLVREILDKHKEERGVVHTVSYNRARNLAFDLNRDCYVHKPPLERDGDQNGDVIDRWEESGKDVLLSPAVSEGVDLKYDMCRFQVLFKVPYPSLSDSRVEHLISERSEWDWYFEEAMKDVVQSYGRAVRSKTDEAVYYVVDKSFKDLINRTNPPKWFIEAMKRG